MKLLENKEKAICYVNYLSNFTTIFWWKIFNLRTALLNYRFLLLIKRWSINWTRWIVSWERWWFLFIWKYKLTSSTNTFWQVITCARHWCVMMIRYISTYWAIIKIIEKKNYYQSYDWMNVTSRTSSQFFASIIFLPGCF